MDHDSDERGETEPVRRKTRIFKNPQSLGEAVRNPLCVLLLLIVIMADAFVAAFAGLYGGALSRRAILFFNPHWRGHMLPHAPEALHTRGSHDWASNVLRGERLVKLMKAKDVLDTDKTTWTSYGDIERYGWTMKAESIDEEEKKVSQSVLKALTIKQLDNTAKPADVDKKKTMGHGALGTHPEHEAHLQRCRGGVPGMSVVSHPASSASDCYRPRMPSTATSTTVTAALSSPVTSRAHSTQRSAGSSIPRSWYRCNTGQTLLS